jgi:hypothetical protein
MPHSARHTLASVARYIHPKINCQLASYLQTAVTRAASDVTGPPGLPCTVTKIDDTLIYNYDRTQYLAHLSSVNSCRFNVVNH